MDIEKFSAIKKNVKLAPFTTFKIGGPAKYFFVANTKEDLIEAIKVAKKIKLPFFILGGGSNILVADEGFGGIVIRIKNQESRIKNQTIYAEAGVLLANLVSATLNNNLTGLEWAIGIPGTVGGAICGNAGAFGESTSDIIEKVEVFDIDELGIKNYELSECKFGYRDSIFKKNKNLIILSVSLRLEKGEPKRIKEKMKEYLNYRRGNQPLNFSSAGSIFKNPQGVSAGELIEKCGLKGKKIGKAQISKNHANFILNLGGASAKDVKKLIKLAKQKVKNNFGVSLQEEICYLGF